MRVRLVIPELLRRLSSAKPLILASCGLAGWGTPCTQSLTLGPSQAQAVPKRSPPVSYIAHAQEDGLTTLHAHRGEGTKFFFHERTTGPNFIQRFMAGATPANASSPSPPIAEGSGLYLETQAGVAPSQSHVFPLPR